jgi:hypothetical protein
VCGRERRVRGGRERVNEEGLTKSESQRERERREREEK